MPDRTINFGESETEATYQIQDTDGAAGGGNFVVAKDTNANTVLLEYQPASDTWQYAGDVDMNGGNVSGVGTLTANSVNTEELGNDSGDLDIITSLFVSETAEFNGSGSGQGGEADTAINIQSGGPNSSRKLVFSDSGGNSVYLQMVAGELIVTDNNGNETTLS